MRKAVVPVFALGAAALVCAALLMFTPRADAQVAVSSSANTQEYEYEWCPGVASTTYPASPPAGARAVYIQNRSSATCYVRFDATAVTTTGATGYRWSPLDERSFDAESSFAGKMTGACTAATTTGACLYTSWWK